LFDEKKKQKKNEETQPIFEGSYLGNTWCDLVEIWNVSWSAFPPQKIIWFC